MQMSSFEITHHDDIVFPLGLFSTSAMTPLPLFVLLLCSAVAQILQAANITSDDVRHVLTDHEFDLSSIIIRPSELSRRRLIENGQEGTETEPSPAEWAALWRQHADDFMRNQKLKTVNVSRTLGDAGFKLITFSTADNQTRTSGSSGVTTQSKLNRLASVTAELTKLGYEWEYNYYM